MADSDRALEGDDRGILTARAGAGRAGAMRAGFAPEDVTMDEADPGAPGPFEPYTEERIEG